MFPLGVYRGPLRMVLKTVAPPGSFYSKAWQTPGSSRGCSRSLTMGEDPTVPWSGERMGGGVGELFCHYGTCSDEHSAGTG